MQKYPKWVDTGEKTPLGEPIGRIVKNPEEEAALAPKAAPEPVKVEKPKPGKPEPVKE
jgi:hypothetical protein